MKEKTVYDVQLFAAGDNGRGSGADASAAGKHASGDHMAPAAGEQAEAAARGRKFRELIEGEFRDEYNASVQSIIKQRLRGSEDTVRKMKALAPALEALEQRYGIEHGDTEALAKAIGQENSGETAEAGERARREKASRLYSRWMQQAAHLRGTYPGFDLSGELANPQFRELLKSGATVRAAYELANRDAIMRAAAEDMEEKITRRILSGAARPRESGLSGGSSAVVRNDVAHMSKNARQEIIRRVQSGEKISF